MSYNLSLEITRENGPFILQALKSSPQKNSTYELRTRILQLCSPEMDTREAYTTSDLKVWVPERIGLWANIIAYLYTHVRALSARLNGSCQQVLGVRGSTGAGKTHFLTEYLSNDSAGVLSPDTIKACLKRLTLTPLTNSQVYEEGTALFALFQQAITTEALRYKIVIDTRLITCAYAEWSLVEAAKRRNGTAYLVDLDVPLEISILRVLCRDPYGKEPCPPLSAIVQGFLQLRAYRAGIIQIAKGPHISKYELFFTDELGKRTLVAEKRESVFKVLDDVLFAESQRIPSEGETRRILKKLITSELIESSVQKRVVTEIQKKMLEKWGGKTLAHALSIHVKGVRGNVREDSFLPEKISTLRQLRNSHLYNYKRLEEIEDKYFCDLFLAVKKGDLQFVEGFLDRTENVAQLILEDALAIGVIFNKPDIVKLLLLRGVNPNPVAIGESWQTAWEERFTPMGHAIDRKNCEMIEILLDHGIGIEECSRNKRLKALDIFFQSFVNPYSSPIALSLILKAGAQVRGLERKTIFKIGVRASVEELELLLDYGFHPKSIFRTECNPEAKGTDRYYLHSSETNLLDLAVMETEWEFVLNQNGDSFKKSALLLSRGADPLSRNNDCDQTYLHRISCPQLIFLFAKINIHSLARIRRWIPKEIKIIETAHIRESIEALCQLGIDREESPFLQGTKAHREALARVGFDPKKGIHQWTKEGKCYLILAAKNGDISAFIALIGVGIDVNERNQSEGKWTVLHELFASISNGSVSDEYDYIHMSQEDFQIQLINILIQHGAAPLKDQYGRTPLMCLNHSPHDISYVRRVIERYANFEADFYGLNRDEYQEKLSRLRYGGLASGGGLIQAVIDQFWESFESSSIFDPPESHNPIIEYNKEIAIMKGY